MPVTTQQHFEVPGGCLKLILTTDDPLTSTERAAFDDIAAACRAFQERRGPRPTGDRERAIPKLSGQEGMRGG